MNSKRVIYTFVIALLGAVLGVYTFILIVKPATEVVTIQEKVVPASRYAAFGQDQQSLVPDLTYSAEKSVHAVVHVMVKAKGVNGDMYSGNPLYDFFFGPRQYQREPSPVVGSGSGVIISDDGYIVTNNHVIDNAHEIEVVLNDKRSYTASLVGADPTTDIALLKIDEKELAFLTFGDSDALKIGEWVLAVGNPFNLTSTVTAGIVSAKSRSINIIANNNQRLGIESFIQTDAAVNPGNSGGALVTTRGELVGINTAIASRTGSYTGYSFAVPASIVRKVVVDLREYGEVQRALLGVSIKDMNSELAEKMNLDRVEGVYVEEVAVGGGAEEAGLESGDVILSVNGEKVNAVPELQEKVSRYRPGDKIKVFVKRDGKQKHFEVVLRNVYGSTKIVEADEITKILGVHLEVVSAEEKRSLKINNGIKVTKVLNGKFKESGVSDGFIIVKANRISISSVDDLKNVVSTLDDGLFLTGLYPNGRVAYYAINLDN